MNDLKEPTRAIAAQASSDGSLRAKTVLTPKACKTRARISVPPDRVMPIIFVPGIMGSNLKVTNGNTGLKPGEPAWRPPNGDEALDEVKRWKARKPVVLVGDRCMCPMTGHQNCVIVSGNDGHTVNGKAVAYHGDKTSCGATLISTVMNFASD